MSKDKCLSRFDTISQPSTKFVVIDASFQTFGMQLNKDFEQSEIEILLLWGSKIGS